MGYHALLQWIFPTQGSNPSLPQCRWILYQLSHQGSPRILEWVVLLQGIFPTQESNQGHLCIAGGFVTNWATREGHSCSYHLGNCKGLRSSMPRTGGREPCVYYLTGKWLRKCSAAKTYGFETSSSCILFFLKFHVILAEIRKQKNTKSKLWTTKGFFPGGSAEKNLPANAGGTGSIPGWGRSPGEGNSNPLKYACLGNPMDRGAWRATVHGVTELDIT